MNGDDADVEMQDAQKQRLYSIMLRQLEDDGQLEAAKQLATTLGVGQVTSVAELPAQFLRDVVSRYDADMQLAATLNLPSAVNNNNTGGASDGAGAGASSSSAAGVDQGADMAMPDKDVLPFPRFESKFAVEHRKATCNAVAFNASGQLFATGASDTSIRVVDVSRIDLEVSTQATSRGRSSSRRSSTSANTNSAVIRKFYDHVSEVTDLCFHPNGRILASGSKDCSVKLFDLAQAHHKRAASVFRDPHQVRSIVFHPSGDFIYVGTDDCMVRMYDVHSGSVFVSPDVTAFHAGSVNQVTFSPSGSLYATASSDGSVKLWDCVTSRCIRTFAGAHGSKGASSVQFSSDSKQLLTSGRDDTIKLFDIGTGAVLSTYADCITHSTHGRAVFDYSGDYVMAADQRTFEVVVWNKYSGEAVERIRAHKRTVGQIAVSPINANFATASDDGSTRFWTVVEEDGDSQMQ